jgi:hypothetical protein
MGVTSSGPSPVRAVLAIWVVVLWAGGGFCAETGERRAHIVKTATPPVIDGLLNDPVWQEADVLKDFTQRIPFSDVPASCATEIRLLRDDQNIYVAAYMKQDPKTITRNKLRHEDSPYLDDTIEIIFDPFHDHLRGWDFLSNPNGARLDTQIDGYKGFNDDWNEVWEVRTSIQPDGWCAEFRIPVRVLRFQPGRDVWGLQVQRRIQYNQENDYWAPVPKQYDHSHLGYAGDVSGFEDLRQARNLQVIPALVPTRLQAADRPRAEYEAEPSLDIKYVMGSKLTLDLTANTDFAQVEADDTQVNLTRFSLFFPEKREFFLESASLFDFGVAKDTQVFFSRRIGIANGQEVPIWGGARLTGKIDKFDLGVMTMETKDSPEQDATNYSVVRVRRALKGRSTIGAIVTNTSSDVYDNRVVGTDTTLWLKPTVRFKGFVAAAQGSSIDGNGFAHNVTLDYLTDPLTLSFSEKTVGAGFDPGIGYVKRRDIRDFTTSAKRRWRLNRDWSRNVDLTGTFTYLTDTDGRLLTRLASVVASNVLPSGSHLDLTLSRSFEQLTEDFKIMPTIVIPLAAYGFQTQTLTWQSGTSQRVQFKSAFSRGSFYGGNQKELIFSNTTHYNRHVRTTVEYQYDKVNLPAGSFNTALARLRANYTFNPEFSINGLLQYNTTTREFSANLVLRVRYARDSSIYFVYNERQTNQTTGWLLGQRAEIFKITYRLYL